jgi:hypothetical protein
VPADLSLLSIRCAICAVCAVWHYWKCGFYCGCQTRSECPIVHVKWTRRILLISAMRLGLFNQTQERVGGCVHLFIGHEHQADNALGFAAFSSLKALGAST